MEPVILENMGKKIIFVFSFFPDWFVLAYRYNSSLELRNCKWLVFGTPTDSFHTKTHENMN